MQTDSAVLGGNATLHLENPEIHRALDFFGGNGSALSLATLATTETRP